MKSNHDRDIKVATNAKQNIKQNDIMQENGLFADIPGAQLTTKDKTTAWVAYQGCAIPGKNSREDAYFMEKLQLIPELSNLLKNMSAKDQAAVITQALEETVDNLQKKCKDLEGGTTLVTAFCFGNKAYVVSVGDSIACTYADNKLSKDSIISYHDATNEAEIDRINKAKGLIARGRVGGMLLVARSIGPFSMDGDGKSAIKGITHKPDIKIVDDTQGKQLFLASDGLEKKIKDGKTGLALLRENTGTQSLENKAKKLLSDNQENLRERDDVTMMVVDPKKGEGAIFGVCDGHGGNESAYTVSKEFGTVFSQQLQQILALKAAEQKSPTPKDAPSPSIPMEHEMEASQQLMACMAYLQKIQELHSELHFISHLKDDTKRFIKKCTLLNKEDDLPPNKKLSMIFEFIEAEISKDMKAKGKTNLNDYIGYLNQEPTRHHQMRLITILYQDLKKNDLKSGLSTKKNNMESDTEINDGKRRVHTFINSIFNKSINPINPYKTAKDLLPTAAIQKVSPEKSRP